MKDVGLATKLYTTDKALEFQISHGITLQRFYSLSGAMPAATRNRRTDFTAPLSVSGRGWGR